MSAFDLDTEGQQMAAEDAAANPVSVDEAKVGALDNLSTAVGNGFMRGGARVGQFIGMAGAVAPILVDKVAGTDYTDRYFKTMDETVNSAVDYWTPNAAETGKAGQVLGGLAEIALPLMAGAGNPTLLIGSQQMGTATDLVRKGVTPGAANLAGMLQGASTAVGFKLPFLGSTLATRIGSGIAGNLVTNTATTAAQQQVLERTGNAEAAKDFDPWNLEARALDVLTGAAFGTLAHVQMRASDQAAVAAANNAKHFQSDTAPGDPANTESFVAHQDAMESAVNDLLEGNPVVPPREALDAAYMPRESPGAAVPDEYQGIKPGLQETNKPPAIEEPTATDNAPPAQAEQVDPIVSAARSLTNDMQIPTGEIDVDGNVKTVSARQLMEQADADVKLAANDSKAYEAAVNCFLQG